MILNRYIKTLFTLLIVFVLAGCAPGAALESIPEAEHPAADLPLEAGAPAHEQARPPAGGVSFAASKHDPALANSALLATNVAEGPRVSLSPVDLRTGKPPAGVEPFHFSAGFSHAYSPDRRTLALYGPDEACPKGCVNLVDLATFTVTRRISDGDLRFSNNGPVLLVFDPAGRQVAAAVHFSVSGGRVGITGVTGQEEMRAADVSVIPRLLAFTADGKGLMVIGRVPSPLKGSLSWLDRSEVRAVLLDAVTLEPLWEQALPGVRDGMYEVEGKAEPENVLSVTAGMAAAPGKSTVYIAHAGEQKLTVVDFARRSVKTLDVRPPRSWLERAVEWALSFGVTPVQAKPGSSATSSAALSLDGRRLYVVGETTQLTRKSEEVWDMAQEPLGLQVWDVESGALLQTVETRSTQLYTGPDGRLVLTGWTNFPFSEIVDVQKGEVLASLGNSYTVPALRLDGTPVLLAYSYDHEGRTYLSVVDGQSLKPGEKWAAGGGYSWSYWLEVK